MNDETIQGRSGSSDSGNGSDSKTKGPIVSKAGWVFLACALVLVVLGFALPGSSGDSDSSTSDAGGALENMGMGNSLVGPSAFETGDSGFGGLEESPWGPALLRGGFSAFLGLALGVAVRSFFRLALIFLGLFFGGLMLFEYWGFVTVEWERIDASFQELVASLELRFGSFKEFMAGRLPAFGLAVTGFGLGIRR